MPEWVGVESKVCRYHLAQTPCIPLETSEDPTSFDEHMLESSVLIFIAEVFRCMLDSRFSRNRKRTILLLNRVVDLKYENITRS